MDKILIDLITWPTKPSARLLEHLRFVLITGNVFDLPFHTQGSGASVDIERQHLILVFRDLVEGTSTKFEGNQEYLKYVRLYMRTKDKYLLSYYEEILKFLICIGADRNKYCNKRVISKINISIKNIEENVL